jgi:hypothetical protein
VLVEGAILATLQTSRAADWRDLADLICLDSAALKARGVARAGVTQPPQFVIPWLRAASRV